MPFVPTMATIVVNFSATAKSNLNRIIQQRMLKKTLSTIAVLLISGMLITAKERAVPPKKFRSADIGNPAIKGSTQLLDEALQITAGGADVWGVRDECHFAWFEQKGDFDLMLRVESLTAPHLYTKAGLMAREELSENSRHIFFQLFPNNKPRNKNNGGFEFQYRQLKGGDMRAIYPATAKGDPEFPVNFPNTWIRLKRTGNEFTGLWSADGKTWKVYTTYILDLQKKLCLGIAITSHNTKEATTAVFSKISLGK